MKFLSALNSWIAKIETVILVLVLSIMIVLAFYQVLVRNLFDQGLLWGDSFLRHLVLWVGFLGASLATRDEKHISIDLFTRFITQKWQPLIRIVTHLFSAVVCWYLTEASWTFVMDEMTFETIAFADVPAWYLQIIIPIGFLMMMFRFSILAIQNFVKLLTGAEDKA